MVMGMNEGVAGVGGAGASHPEDAHFYTAPELNQNSFPYPTKSSDTWQLGILVY